MSFTTECPIASLGSTQGHSPRKLRCGHTPPRIKPLLNRTQYSLHHSSTVHSMSSLSFSSPEERGRSLPITLTKRTRSPHLLSAPLSLSLSSFHFVAHSHNTHCSIFDRQTPFARRSGTHTHAGLFSVPPPSSSSTFSTAFQTHTHTDNNRRAHAFHGSADPPSQKKPHTHHSITRNRTHTIAAHAHSSDISSYSNANAE